MKTRSSFIQTCSSLLFSLLLAFGPGVSGPRTVLAEAPAGRLLLLAETGEVYDLSASYRTIVQLETAYDRTRLERTGATIVRDLGAAAVVLADEQQLEDLARLGLQPRTTDALSALAPQLATVDADGSAEVIAASESAVASTGSIDNDGDGLTDTEEGWWGTDPNCTDSDGDGYSDATETEALLEWMGNQRDGPPSAMGKPFQGWPPLTTSACDATRHFAVPDDDRDSVPDLAERWVLGLNMNWESTDHDKFDDGQELFGLTNCPGGDQSCGYGDLPRSADAGFVGAEMPGWVKAPGEHPLVGAFARLDVTIDPEIHVEIVTTVTTDHVISEGTESSWSTATMEGTSDSTAKTS